MILDWVLILTFFCVILQIKVIIYKEHCAESLHEKYESVAAKTNLYL